MSMRKSIPKTVKAEILHTPHNAPMYQWTLKIEDAKGDLFYFDIHKIKKLYHEGKLERDFIHEKPNI